MNENFLEIIEFFDFLNVEIGDIICVISELMGKNFIIDFGVCGKIMIIVLLKFIVVEVYKVFLLVLVINGFIVVFLGSFLKVKLVWNVQCDSIEIYFGFYYLNLD